MACSITILGLCSTIVNLPQNIGSSCGRTGRIKHVSLDIGCSTGTRNSAQKQAPAIDVLLRLGHCHGLGTVSPKNPYNRLCSLKNSSILKQLNA